MNYGKLTVKERCNAFGTCLIRRGIPFASGELKAGEDISFYNSDGSLVKSQNRVIQTFDNGDIQWLATSFVTRLEANEEKEFTFEKSKQLKKAGKNIAQETSVGFILENEQSVRLEITGHKIRSLKYCGADIIKENGLVLQVSANGNIHDFCPTKTRLLENGDVFAQVLIEGKFEGLDVYGSWIITLHQNSTEICQEAKFNVRDEMVLEGQWISIGFSNRLHEDQKNRDWISYEDNNVSVVASSKDIERFQGTVDGRTGFIDHENSIVLAPIQYNTPFFWPDGVTRTFRLKLIMTTKEKVEQEAKRSIDWSIHTPVAVLEAQRYVLTGKLDSVCRSGVVKRIEDLITSMYGKCWHHIEAGKMPHCIEVDYETEEIKEAQWKTLHRSSGELNFNLWVAFMNSGNELMADMLSEHAEFWTDIMYYRGKHKFLHGEARYKSGMSWYEAPDFSLSSPYYSDLSGLYQDYVMTGEVYYGECLKEAAYHMLEGFEKNGYPLISCWFRDSSMLTFYDSPDFQIRFAAAVRCMYLAYELYHDERFLKITESTIDYIQQLQGDDGLFFEAYDRTTLQPTAFYQSPYGVVLEEKFAYLEKIYIMVFANRAICEYYNMHHYPPTLEIMENLGDYLWRQMMDDGWYFAPNSTDHYFDNENQRGCCGDTVSCVMNFFSSLFEATKKKKHLLWLLKTTRFYISTFGGKSFGIHMPVGALGFLRCAPRIFKHLKNYREIAIGMGFYDLVSIFDDRTIVERDRGYDTRGRHIAKNIFKTPNNEIQYFCVNTGGLKPTYTCFEHAYKLNDTLSLDGRLWIGEPNFVTGRHVAIDREVERVDLIHIMETDIYLEGNINKTRVDLYRVTSDEITFNIKGSGVVELVIRDGLFPVEDRVYKMVAYQYSEEFVALNGEVRIPIHLIGELQYFKITKHSQ